VTNEEKIRLVLETLGADNVRQAAKAMRELEKSTKDVGDAKDVAAKKSRDFGQSMMTAAYFVDDMQYGLRGIVNNIPQMVQAMGGGMVAAGAFGIAMVGVNQALQWFDTNVEDKTKKSLKDIETGHADASVAVRKHEKSLKDLEERTPKVAAEYAKYIDTIDRLKKAKEELAAAEEAERIAAADAKKEAEADNEAKTSLATVYDDLVNKTGESGKLQETLQNQIVNQALIDRQRSIDAAIESPTKVVRVNGRNVIRSTDQEFTDTKRTIAEQGTNFLLSDDKLNELAKNEIMAKARGQATLGSRAEVNNLVRNIQGKGSRDEQLQAFERLKELAPDLAGQMGETLQFDNQGAQFDAGNERWRQGPGARRRAAERAFAEGERTGAAMLPNRGTMIEADMEARAKQRAEEEARDKKNREIMAGLTGQLPDPATLAAMRRQNAGIGVGAVGRMRMAEEMDQNALYGTFRQSGMADQDARRMVGEYMQQGNEAFSEFAQANGQNSKNITEGLRAAMQFMRKVQQDQEETRQIIQWMQSMNGGTDVRPQQNRARN
jgi:hypothetical protein